jgi:hypothetical protein
MKESTPASRKAHQPQEMYTPASRNVGVRGRRINKRELDLSDLYDPINNPTITPSSYGRGFIASPSSSDGRIFYNGLGAMSNQSFSISPSQMFSPVSPAHSLSPDGLP